jgi:cytochrome c-type biogenesis protein CcmH
MNSALTSTIWPAAIGLWVLSSAFVAWPLWRKQAAVHPEQSLPVQSDRHDRGARPRRMHALVLSGLLGITTAGLYAVVGHPQAIDATAPQAVEAEGGNVTELSKPLAPPFAEKPETPGTNGGAPTAAQIEGMVARLAQRLQAQPQDPDGWRMLARSYETLGRFDAAVQAYQQLLKVQAPTPDVLTDFAVVLGMSRGQTLSGDPEALLDQALKLDPRHVQALALSGSAAYERGDYARAVVHWRKLLTLIPEGEPMRATIEQQVDKAQSLVR